MCYEVGHLNYDCCLSHLSESPTPGCTDFSSRPFMSSFGRRGAVNFFPSWVGWSPPPARKDCFLIKKRLGGDSGRPPCPSSAVLPGVGAWSLHPASLQTPCWWIELVLLVVVERPRPNPQNLGMLSCTAKGTLQLGLG